MSLSVLQLQTQAGHSTQPLPISPLKAQNSSDDSIQTLSSSVGSNSPKTSLDIVRCSRCQRSLSIDTSVPANTQGIIRFGVNSYYCARCANVVGFIK